MDDVAQLFETLTALHPRSTQVLLARFVAPTQTGAGRSRAAFAAHYGIDEAAADVLLFRAVAEWRARRHGTTPTVLPDGEEARQAELLRLALDAPAQAGELAAVVASLQALTTHAETLRQKLAEADDAEVRSPEYARETWLRRIAIVAILALSAWFYKAELTTWWQQHARDTTVDAGE